MSLEHEFKIIVDGILRGQGDHDTNIMLVAKVYRLIERQGY